MGQMHMGNFSFGMSKVQMFQMNQLQNDDIMNVNRWHIYGLNE